MKPMKLAALFLCLFMLCGLTENKSANHKAANPKTAGQKAPPAKTAPKTGENYTISTVVRTGTITVPPAGDAGSLQPGDERAAQDALPKSDHAMWGALARATVRLDDKTGIFDVKYDDSVKALDGRPLAITGFMLPLEGSEKQKHFLLSKRTPTCPFCMPGGPTEVIEVFCDTPVTWVDDMIQVKGTLALVPPNENGMLYQLKNAAEIAK